MERVARSRAVGGLKKKALRLSSQGSCAYRGASLRGLKPESLKWCKWHG
jgi:hypothetical protein